MLLLQTSTVFVSQILLYVTFDQSFKNQQLTEEEKTLLTKALHKVIPQLI